MVNKKMVGRTIKSKRVALHISQKELADKCKLSRSYMCDVESGRYLPSLKFLVLISQNLNLDLNFLLNCTEIIDKKEVNSKC